MVTIHLIVSKIYRAHDVQFVANLLRTISAIFKDHQKDTAISLENIKEYKVIDGECRKTHFEKNWNALGALVCLRALPFKLHQIFISDGYPH